MSQLNEATDALVQAFVRCMPKGKNKQTNETEWNKALGKFFVDAREIRTRYGLGFIARARVAYQLQGRLLASGFDADTVKKVVFSLVLNAFAGSKK